MDGASRDLRERPNRGDRRLFLTMEPAEYNINEDKAHRIDVKELRKLCYQRLDLGNIDLAMETARRLQEALSSPLDALSTLEKAEVACILVDVGAAAGDETMVDSGVDLFNRHYAVFSDFIEPDSLEYNLGNGKKSLHDIAVAKRKEAFKPETINLATEAKAHYWKALKLVGDRKAAPELLVNLANCLDQCGRVVEALMWYDRALALDPAFGMAHLNKGHALLYLNKIADSYTIKLLDEARSCFTAAKSWGPLPRDLKENAEHQQHSLTETLLSLGYDQERLHAGAHHDIEEYEAHHPYWRWCLDNFIVLSEHSLYCRCAGARRDDLAIPKQSGSIGGEFVPKLELLLNRIKSEFCLARALHYQGAVLTADAGWDTKPFDGTFTELYDHETIGLRSEFLRTSFRLCFGVLDKIARGIANLFGLAPVTETLYFESFWRPTNERKKGEERRWQLINEQHNHGLVALFSLATDLNRVGGEWSHYKENRNQLEHGIFLIRENEGEGAQQGNLVDLEGLKTVSVAEFIEANLRMLQFTASAIFSFAFCVRIEGLKAHNPKGAQVVLGKKVDIGKA